MSCQLISTVFSPEEQRNEQMELSIWLDKARKRGLVDDKVRKRSCLRSGFDNGRFLEPALSVNQRKFKSNKFLIRRHIGVEPTIPLQ